MTQWIFVRHGQSTANAEGWLAGIIDAPLTPAGSADASRAAAALRDHAIDRVCCSDLVRAIATAKTIVRNRSIPLLCSPALRERSAGALTRTQLAANRDEVIPLRHWGARPPGGESLRDVALRALPWLDSLSRVNTTLLVGHGALIRTLVGLIDGVAEDAFDQWHPRNAEIVEREVPATCWQALLCTLLRDDRLTSRTSRG